VGKKSFKNNFELFEICNRMQIKESFRISIFQIILLSKNLMVKVSITKEWSKKSKMAILGLISSIVMIIVVLLD